MRGLNDDDLEQWEHFVDVEVAAMREEFGTQGEIMKVRVEVRGGSVPEVMKGIVLPSVVGVFVWVQLDQVRGWAAVLDYGDTAGGPFDDDESQAWFEWRMDASRQFSDWAHESLGVGDPPAGWRAAAPGEDVQVREWLSQNMD